MNLLHVDVVYVLLYNEATDQVLTVKNERHWSLPGGRREHGELLIQAAVREAREETGLDVQVADIVHITEKVVGNHHATFITFRGEITGGEMGTTDDEIQEIAWKTIEDAQQLMPYLGDIRELLHIRARYAVE